MEENYVITVNGIVKLNEAVNGYVCEISTKEDLEDLIERMPYIRTIHAPNSKTREELYDLSMKEYDDVEWVKVIKSIYLRMEEKHYDDFEEKYIKRAKEFLYGEIAIRFDISFSFFVIRDTEKQGFQSFVLQKENNGVKLWLAITNKRFNRQTCLRGGKT